MPTDKQEKALAKKAEMLHDAIKLKKIKAVSELCDPDVVNIPEKGAGWTPLHQAAFAGSIPIAKILIDQKADLEAMCESCGGTPLHLACSKA